MMLGLEKSDPAIVATKPTNEAEQPAADPTAEELKAVEPVERRVGTEGNAVQQSTRRTQSRTSVSRALERIRKVARERKKERFTALFHHIDTELLEEAFYELAQNAAPGVDRLTWKDYEADLERNIEDLHDRVQRGAYRALPSRRVYIPKPDGRQRPLAVAALEDKIVQRAVVALLNAIYEEDFLGFSYGFRPGRGAHDALDALCVGIHGKKVSFILDADIRSFFDEISQQWLIRFLEHRIGDRRIIRLIRKWLKAGILEDGVVSVSDSGTGQGSVILTAACQRLPALRARSLGRTLATARGHGRYDHRALCRQLHRRLPAPSRRSGLSGANARTVGEVCVDTASREDPADRVRALCSGSKSYRGLQPFGQVPAYENDELKLFESGAIVMHIAIYSMAPSFVCSRVATIAAYTSCVMATPSLSRRANNSKISSLSALFSILRRISSGNFIGASYQNTLCLI
jgi:retron-type reverse transcriptase